MKPRKGSLAFCGLNCLGLITSDRKKKVRYDDGKFGYAWTGIHLTDKIAEIGSPWSSRTPRVIGHVESMAGGDDSN